MQVYLPQKSGFEQLRLAHSFKCIELARNAILREEPLSLRHRHSKQPSAYASSRSRYRSSCSFNFAAYEGLERITSSSEM